MLRARLIHTALGLAGAALLAACGDLSGALPPRPSPVPTLARLPTVTPPRPTLTPLPTIPPIVLSPTPEPSVELLAVVVRNANIRSGPGTDYEIVGIAEEGMQIALIGMRDGWYAMSTAEGLEGWMSETVLEIDPQTAEAVPLASP
jgi:hypothetical protein